MRAAAFALAALALFAVIVLLGPASPRPSTTTPPAPPFPLGGDADDFVDLPRHRHTYQNAPYVAGAEQSVVPDVGHAHMNRVDARLYVGNFHAALAVLQDDALARRLNISAVVNTAWDWDPPALPAAMTGSVEGSNLHFRLRYGKVGLVDGPGNTMAALAAAVQLVGAYAHPTSAHSLLRKDAGTFDLSGGGAVLVHCIFGQSRSVTVAALYLYYAGRFGSFDAALEFIRGRRGLAEQPTKPQRDVVALARALLQRQPAMDVL